jgi:hypothetical protein
VAGACAAGAGLAGADPPFSCAITASSTLEDAVFTSTPAALSFSSSSLEEMPSFFAAS